ncbi:MAG TPA: MIP/aquaporin family protein [Planctomycetota bacterium]|nr:MIP/aquaporin family protein [Planctomycetota bacterium]
MRADRDPGPSLARRCLAEATGTAFLLAAVVGSGVMADRLCGGNVAVALLANAVATGGALVALILAFGATSGAHLNPAVSALLAARGELRRGDLAPYVAAQLFGAACGTAAAHLMFGEPAFAASTHVRAGFAQAFSEGVATAGLLLTIVLCGRARPEATPFAVAGYIVAAYWFTASTSFANPAVTLARCLTDTFSGIRPSDVPGFLAGQAAGGAAAWGLLAFLAPPDGAAALQRTSP